MLINCAHWVRSLWLVIATEMLVSRARRFRRARETTEMPPQNIHVAGVGALLYFIIIIIIIIM